MPAFRTVIFDCDSTLTTIEGIEELAGGVRPEIARLTEQAMRGDIALEEVYGRRLALIRPTRKAVAALGRRYVECLVPDARETIAALHAEGIATRLISGGLKPAVLVLARSLAMSEGDVEAVDVFFDGDEYRGFDDRSPLAASGGKRVAIEQRLGDLSAPVMMVGDGATDLEAMPVVDLFVAFAGVASHERVTSAAPVVVRATSLAPILTLAIGVQPPFDPLSRVTYDKGLRLLDARYHPV
ncbi:MAG: HAD-IB family phosphatase [Gemmatimonadota bacterium]|nr:HAD-IB family phosphatase [Gemmatimonadota bacterium]